MSIRKTIIALSAVALMFLILPAQAEETFEYDKHVFDFGHVAIDFTVFHRYTWVNPTDQSVRIVEADVNCDCSTVRLVDSLLEPGDTAFFDLAFSTRDYYGYTSKSLTVVTDHPKIGTFKFYYVSYVGQWLNGLMPNPLYLFFLPGKGGQKVTIPNVQFDKIKLAGYVQYDSTFTVKVLKDSVGKGKSLELEVIPQDNLKKGNHLSTLTLEIEASGEEKPIFLSIPIKIARY